MDESGGDRFGHQMYAEKDIVDIAAKRIDSDDLTVDYEKAGYWGRIFTVYLPGGILALGGIVWLLRRKKQ